jgi:hypothetical protein
MWLVAAAIVVAIAVSAFVAMTGDSTPTVTFDGQTATYDGPATFEAGEHTFVFDGSAYEPDHAFSLGVIEDPTITAADLEAYAASGVSSATQLSPFRFKIFWVVEDDAEARILEETFELEADTRYALEVISRPDDQVFFAATFEVE